MVNIPMRTAGSFNANNINSINSTKVQTSKSTHKNYIQTKPKTPTPPKYPYLELYEASS